MKSYDFVNDVFVDLLLKNDSSLRNFVVIDGSGSSEWLSRPYNTLVDERGLSISTVDSIHTVLHQVLDMAVDDAYIRHNPADNVLKELKQTHAKPDERRALTKAEQELFLNFLKRSEKFRH